MVAKDSAATQRAEGMFEITRVFDAPRELVFKAWTEPERLERWWWPKGFTMRECRLDLRPGGVFQYCLRSPDGHDMWGKFVFREIAKPERLVFIVSFCDEAGNPVRHPLSPDWPLEVLSTVTFSEHGGRTTVTIQWVPVNATESERKTFEAGRDSMQQGFTGTFDQLTDYLAKADREIAITRVFDAPRELVFKMWTDPTHVAQWWGPKGFTNTIDEMDVRPGGVWRFVMHGPDGVDYQNKIVYVEVVKPERLVYDHVSGPQFHVTVTFAEQGDKTRLSMQMLFESAAARDHVVKKYGSVEGLSQTLGRLEQHLAKM